MPLSNAHSAERISFSKGATSTTVTGSVAGYDTKSYLFGARAGQTLQLHLNSKNRFLYFVLLDASDQKDIHGGDTPETLTEWSGSLPKNGDYEVKVFLMRAEARRNGKAEYSLDLRIQ